MNVVCCLAYILSCQRRLASRAILYIALFAAPCVFAVDHITCNILSSGIPAESRPNIQYENTYECRNTYPPSFPAIQLVGNVIGDTTGTSVSGTCATQPLAPGAQCQFVLGFHPIAPGSHSFNLQVSVGTLYFLNLPAVASNTVEGPVITWPGRTSGTAHVDLNGDGEGAFSADATDSSGHAVFYTFALSGAGTVMAGPTLGNFILTGAIDNNETVTVTANADDAPSVVGEPIPIVMTSVLTKQVIIFNNSNAPIFPVIEAPILSVSDAWLQAQFQETNVDVNTFTQTNLNRIYINPTTGGMAAGSMVTINVPFYSQLATVPNPALPNQYIDWWNGMRVYIFDDLASVTAAYDIDKLHPVNPLTPGPVCDAESACHEPLNIYSNNGSNAFLLNDPFQLTEYTFANVVTSEGVPYPIDTKYVDYDISYVDGTYLPVAMEPHGNNEIGFTGTVMDLTTFRTKLLQFVSNESWPIYTKVPPYPNPKLPGTYNVTLGNQPMTPNNIFAHIKTNWTDCTTNVGNSQFADCTNVKNLFDLNQANYLAVCPGPPPAPTFDEYLQHVYGWVPFTCPTNTNELTLTPGADYQLAVKSYIALQYNYQLDPPPLPFVFNPYVGLIHSPTYLDMNAYAFSIDDAVGNMNVLGNGIIIAVAGANGLPNGNPFDPTKVAKVNLGAPTGGLPTWVSYGICSATTNKELSPGTLNFQIFTVNYPCEITLKDSDDKLYHFTVLQSPPFTSGTTSDYIQCPPGNMWCAGIIIDFNTQHDIDTPPTITFAKSTKVKRAHIQKHHGVR